MVPQTAPTPPTPVLITLLGLIDELPLAPSAVRRGRPCLYSERLFLKALVVMIVRHLPTIHALVAVLAEPEMASVRAALCEHGALPTRRTFERRLRALPTRLPEQIALVGATLLRVLDPWATGSRAVALDSTALPARGRPWHKRQRAAGEVPHTQIDTEAHWTHSGWHGWVYGWKLHLVVTVGAIWLPLAAELTPANRADNTQAPAVLAALDPRTLSALAVLADVAYNDPKLYAFCAQRHATLITTQRGSYPHHDDGVEVRRLFHQLRTHAIENFNGQFKAIFDAARAVPTKGLVATQRWVLGAVLVYQLALLACFRAQRGLRQGLKAFLQAA